MTFWFIHLLQKYLKSSKKKDIDKKGVLASYEFTEGLRNLMIISSKPSYFDLTWEQYT